MCIISSCTVSVLIGQIGFLSGFDFSGSCIYMISRGWWFYATLKKYIIWKLLRYIYKLFITGGEMQYQSRISE